MDAIEIKRPALFVADLHLHAGAPSLLQSASALFSSLPGQYRQLFIVGDLLEYWLGDDTPEGALAAVFDSLKQASEAGCEIHLLHGNRDFLLGERFAERIGATLHRDDSVRLLGGHEGDALLLHGDTLCTDDIDYLTMRKKLRDPTFQSGFLALPLEERARQAEQLRASSAEAMSAKDQAIMDVNGAAVTALAATSTVASLIHGHTHRPALHLHEREDAPMLRRYVLGDWRSDGAEVLRWDANGAQLFDVTTLPSTPGTPPPFPE